MKTSSTHYGILLATITMVLFFATYYFFIGFNYYDISMKVNAFVLPIIYVLITVIFLHKITSARRINFSEAFQNSFKIMFTGGTISFLLIILFFKNVDPDAQSLLQHQKIEHYLANAHKEYKEIQEPTQEETQLYQQVVKSLNSEEIKNANFFSLKDSLFFLTALYAFYLIISVFLAIFFRTKKSHAAFNSHTPS